MHTCKTIHMRQKREYKSNTLNAVVKGAYWQKERQILFLEDTILLLTHSCHLVLLRIVTMLSMGCTEQKDLQNQHPPYVN